MAVFKGTLALHSIPGLDDRNLQTPQFVGLPLKVHIICVRNTLVVRFELAGLVAVYIRKKYCTFVNIC